jgi:DNA-binding NtrC family response regulator
MSSTKNQPHPHCITEPAGPKIRSTTRAMPSVLLVEDDTDNRESITDALHAEGFRVSAVPHAAQALKLLDDPGCPDLILLDLWLRGVSGGQLLAAVALHQDRERFRVIVMSAAPDASTFARRPRVVEVLQKPFALERLLATVRRHA